MAAKDERRVYQFQQRQVAPLSEQADPIQLRFGRFYPLGVLKNMAGVYPNNITPFRCVFTNGDGITGDANHPLAEKPFQFKASIKDVREKFEEHGGTSIDWIETTLSGPGMQARVNGDPTNFFADHPFRRMDENPDHRFYQQPRLVYHIDRTAIDVIGGLYRRLLQPESRVLDLMSSWVSHLPPDLPPAELRQRRPPSGAAAGVWPAQRGPPPRVAALCPVSIEPLADGPPRDP